MSKANLNTWQKSLDDGSVRGADIALACFSMFFSHDRQYGYGLDLVPFIPLSFLLMVLCTCSTIVHIQTIQNSVQATDYWRQTPSNNPSYLDCGFHDPHNVMITMGIVSGALVQGAELDLD
jgi:hypothetical protein